MSALRDYQAQALTDLRRSVATGHRAPVLVSPTGSGKTVIAKALIESAANKGRSVLFLAPRRELIFQTCEKLDAAGVDFGVIMAGQQPRRWAAVQVACIPSILARWTRGERLPEADLICVDEAHLSIADGTQRVLAAYPDAVKIGLTATPARTDGRGLGAVYDDLVMGPTVAWLTQHGHLVPARYFAPSKPDLVGVRMQAGDYNQKQLGERMAPLVGDVVTNWLRIAPDRKTVVFSVNVAHSQALREQFTAAGVRAEHLDGTTPNDERAAILARLRDGATQVLTNCDVCTYGWDEPSISCAVLARPTKSLPRYFQMVGRVLRPYAGKTDCLVIDHGGTVDEFGFVDEPVEWKLDADGKVQERGRFEKRKESKITCADCATVYSGCRTCPHCGYEPPARLAKAIECIDDDLAELDRQKKRSNRDWTNEQKSEFYGELKHYCQTKGYSEGWASNKYRERFGVWPNAHKWAEPREPTPETLSWIRSRQIAWAKSKQRQKVAA